MPTFSKALRRSDSTDFRNLFYGKSAQGHQVRRKPEKKMNFFEIENLFVFLGALGALVVKDL
jgi:hypothetical protein